MNNIGPPIPIVSESASRAEQYRKKSNTYQSANATQRHTIKRLEAALREILASCTLDTVHDIAREAISK